MRDLREQLLGIIEKNSRIDLKELAVILGVEEVDVVNGTGGHGIGRNHLRLPYAD